MYIRSLLGEAGVIRRSTKSEGIARVSIRDISHGFGDSDGASRQGEHHFEAMTT